MNEDEFKDALNFKGKLFDAGAHNILAYVNRKDVTNAQDLIESLKKDIDSELDKLSDEEITNHAYKIDPNDPKALQVAKEVHMQAVKMYSDWLKISKEIFSIK